MCSVAVDVVTILEVIFRDLEFHFNFIEKTTWIHVAFQYNKHPTAFHNNY